MKKFATFFLLVFVAVSYADKWTEQIEILMTEQEKAEYKKLKSDSEKEKFVEQFWVKRDPTPGTPENEYKTNYERNFAEVNARLKDKSAYRSDMGQTLLLLGPPTEQKREEGQQAPALDEDEPTEVAPGKQTWVYKSLPAGVTSGEVTIEFKPSGREWRFADRKQMEALLEKARQSPIDAAKKAAESTPTTAPVAQPQMTPTMGADQPPPVTTPELKTALDQTLSGAPPSEVPVSGLADSWMTSTGDVFSTFAVQSAGTAAGAKVGIRIADSTGNVVKEAELPFVDASANPPEAAGYFQTNLPITPGEYTVAMAVSSDGKTGGVKKSLSVPNYDGNFQISSIILSKGHQKLAEAKPEKTPYTFGQIKVDPNVSRTFSKTDELIVVYEAYNFQPDPSGKPNLEANIGFQKGSEKPRDLPAAVVNGLVTGKKITVPTSFSLSEKFFTPGQWKLILKLTDKISNQSDTQEASFTIQ
jgi:GWxTD domain-containing protein